MTRFLKGESGYSLVEVMASILILAMAIIPMVGMFDMGLNLATRGGNYDKARALANLKLEEAKSLSFAEVENDFPQMGNTTPYEDDTAWLTEPGVSGLGDEFEGFTYNVEKQYMAGPPEQPGDETWNFPSPSDTATGLIRVTVTVQWGAGNEYTTLGLVAE